MPIHQSEIYKRYCRERDVEMAETIKKEINGKCIAIFGAAHYTGIKRELENSSIRTNGKYTQKIMDIFN